MRPARLGHACGWTCFAWYVMTPTRLHCRGRGRAAVTSCAPSRRLCAARLSGRGSSGLAMAGPGSRQTAAWPSAAGGLATWDSAWLARPCRSRPRRAALPGGCHRGGLATTIMCCAVTGRRDSGSSRHCGHRTGPALRARLAELRGRASRGRPEPRGYSCGDFRLIPSAAEHQAAVRRAVEYIRRGDIFQANICLRLEADFDGDPLDAFCAAVPVLDPPYAAFLRPPRRRGRQPVARAVPAP